MRRTLNRELLGELLAALARSAPRSGNYRVYLIGGGTAVLQGWRDATIDADLFSDQQEVFREIQAIKERLRVSIEFVRPEHFVPPLAGTEERHVFIEMKRNVSFYHYDPYAQLFSKLVRGFQRDMQDAENFLVSGMVDPELFVRLVREVPEATYNQYPALSRSEVLSLVDQFVARRP